MKRNAERIWNPCYLVLFLTNVIANTSFYMSSTVLSTYLVGIGMTAAAAGTLIGIMPTASMLVRPFSGCICDRFSRKRLLQLCLGVNFLAVMGYGVAKDPAIFLVLRVLHGAAFGISTTIVMAMIAGYIPKQRMGEGLGYFGLAQSVAMAVGPSMGLWLMSAFGGTAMFTSAAILCAGAAVMVQRLPAEKEKKRHPEKERLRVRSFIAKEAILFAVISIAISSVNGVENGFIALYGTVMGLKNVGWYFTLSAVTLIFSRVLFGRLSDRWGFKAVFYPGIVLIAAALVLLAVSAPESAAVFFACASVTKAIGVGAVQPALQAAAVQAVSPDQRGAAASTFYLGSDLGQASAPPVAGKLIDALGYSRMYLGYLLPLALAAVLYTVSLLYQKRREKA